ncbi:hypothetical protein [Paenibacillus thalictri]|uniref:Uncharacterized protein n=1 Tax=Paenibacillus thalictri TaxID=2527873 RepID=A0A4Q9DJ66_9BACL|nr:hypothetical protein [Paenibacillus thalictri]TBL73979.1 hypothetical protein EYB31_26150 [Paenibacillus thalictri]
MKTSKWLKWQIGAVGAVGLAVLLQQVKDSPAFAMAYADATASAKHTTSAQASAKDPVMDEWHKQSGSFDAGTQRHSRRSNVGSTGNGRRGGGSISGDSSSAQSNAAPGQKTQTRTGRS